MKRGLIKGMAAGMILGGAAATLFGVLNWQTERAWNRQLRRGGKWLSKVTDEWTGRF